MSHEKGTAIHEYTSTCIQIHVYMYWYTSTCIHKNSQLMCYMSYEWFITADMYTDGLHGDGYKYKWEYLQ